MYFDRPQPFVGQLTVRYNLQFGKVWNLDFLAVVHNDAGSFQIVQELCCRLARGADDLRDVMLREVIFDGRAVARYNAFALDPIFQETVQPAFGVFGYEIGVVVPDAFHAQPDEFGVRQSKVRIPEQQILKVRHQETADGNLIGQNFCIFIDFSVGFEFELPEQIAFADDILDGFVTLVVHGNNLDVAALEQENPGHFRLREIDDFAFLGFFEPDDDAQLLDLAETQRAEKFVIAQVPIFEFFVHPVFFDGLIRTCRIQTRPKFADKNNKKSPMQSPDFMLIFNRIFTIRAK